jgi:Protein of unknown function (DUF2283)
MGGAKTRFDMTYDADADVLGIWLPGLAGDARTREIAPGVHADVTPDGRLVALQVLDASERYPAESLRRLGAPEDWLTLAEASAESGITPDALRRQALNGRLTARKRGRDWIVSASALWNYLESRAPSGRPPSSARGRRLRRSARGFVSA